MAGQNFWVSNNTEPKRAHRFLLSLGNVGGQQGISEFVIQTVARPSFSRSTVEMNFLDKVFKYPGKTTWNDITVNIIDAVAPNGAATLFDILRRSGFTPPDSITPSLQRQELVTVSKRRSMAALGTPRIKMLTSEGDVLEEWTLNQAWISAVEFGELSYESDDKLMINLTIVYDWASLRVTGTPLRQIPV